MTTVAEEQKLTLDPNAAIKELGSGALQERLGVLDHHAPTNAAAPAAFAVESKRASA